MGCQYFMEGIVNRNWWGAWVCLGSDQAMLFIFMAYLSKNKCFQALKHHFQGQKHPYKGRLVLEVHRLHYS